MKRTYAVQLIIDAIIIFSGLINYIIPIFINNHAIMFFYTEMIVYGIFELLEYFFDKTSKEPLLLCGASFISAFTSLFIFKSSNLVLALSVAIWMTLIIFIKAFYLSKIKDNLTHLFYARLTEISIITLVGILTSINLYFNLSSIAYMLGFLYLGYGVLEIGCDFLTFLSTNPKVLKE